MAGVPLSLDPVVLAALLAPAALYVRAVRILRRRGVRVSHVQQGAWWIGMTLEVIGLVSPLDAYADQVLSAHMAQHLLIGDVAAPFLLAGIRSPVLVFLLPRPVLVALARRGALRRAFRFARRPLVALPIYIATIYGWHLAFLFEAALRHPAIHALQHQSFVAANLLLWWAVLEPKRRRMPGDLWKIAYIFAARMSTMFLGMGFVFAHGALYGGFYGERAMRYGFTPLGDQQTAGGMMMILDIVIMFLALCYFFWHAAAEGARTDAADRAVVPAA